MGFFTFFHSAEARCTAEASKDEVKKAQEQTAKLKAEVTGLKTQQGEDKKLLEDTKTEAEGFKKELGLVKQESNKRQQSIETLQKQL